MNDTDLNRAKIRPSSTRTSSPSLTRLPSRSPRCHLAFSTALHSARESGGSSSAGAAVRGQGEAFPWKHPAVFSLNPWRHAVRNVLVFTLNEGAFPLGKRPNERHRQSTPGSLGRPGGPGAGRPRHRNAEAATSWPLGPARPPRRCSHHLLSAGRTEGKRSSGAQKGKGFDPAQAHRLFNKTPQRTPSKRALLCSLWLTRGLRMPLKLCISLRDVRDKNASVARGNILIWEIKSKYEKSK